MAPSTLLLPWRPARAAQELRLPAVAELESLDHPPAALLASLAARDELREAVPVEDLLQQHDLVMPSGAGGDGPAGFDRDHAALLHLGKEDRAERVGIGVELAGEGPARVVQVHGRRVGRGLRRWRREV